jgi:Flp pilus assembly protein TadD
LGTFLANHNRREEAEAALRRAAELTTTCGAAHALATFLLHQNRDDEAGEYYKKALSSNPACTCGADGLARLLVKDGKHDEAEKLLREVIDKDLTSARAHSLLAQFLAGSKKIEEAKSEYVRAIELSDEKSEIAEDLTSLIITSESDPSALVNQLQEIKNMIRQDAVALNSVAWIVHQRARTIQCPSEALEFATSLSRDALGLKPDKWSFKHTLGALLCDRGKVAEALIEVEDLADGLTESNLDDFIELCVAVGQVDPTGLLARLEKSSAKGMIEPLIVALQIVIGREIHVAQEILEVAKDLSAQMQRRELDASE